MNAQPSSARALYPKLAAYGVNLKTGAVPCSLSAVEAGRLIGRMRVSTAELWEVLEGRDPNLVAIQEEGAA